MLIYISQNHMNLIHYIQYCSDTNLNEHLESLIVFVYRIPIDMENIAMKSFDNQYVVFIWLKGLVPKNLTAPYAMM